MPQTRASERLDRPAEWRSKLAGIVVGLLLFETLTGLAICVLPFSLPVQFSVLVHSAVGLIFLIPFLWYQARHWWVYRYAPMTQAKVMGYLALTSALICAASGVVLTAQAVWGTRIGYEWDRVHLVSTFAVVAFAFPHVIALLARDRKRKQDLEFSDVMAAEGRFARTALGATAALIAVPAVWLFVYEPVEFRNVLPPDYDYRYGADRPFAPSLAKTTTGSALDARSLAGSEACGTSGCHEQIVEEWQPSAHRYAAMDAAFQAVQKVMAEQNGPESTRYCGGCHDPISLFSGTKTILADSLTVQAGYQEGVSCIVCHAIQKTDVKGNADYTMAQPRRYAYELKEGPAQRFLRDFLIRA